MTARLKAAPPEAFREFGRNATEQGIHQRIEQQVELAPNHIALVTRDARYTYSEMNGFANSIAEAILDVAGPDLAQAAVLQPNTPDLIFSLLGCLKARKAYVPLDPNFPRQRLQMMLEDAEPALLLTDEKHLPLAGQLAGRNLRILNTTAIRRLADAPNPQLACDPKERAYILFTSGSTGRPKGMAFPHRMLLSGTRAMTDALHFAPSDRVTWLHSASFAASVVDIYCSLCNGATLYPWDTKTRGFTGLADWLTGERVTTFQWIPSAFRHFLRTVPEDFVFRDIRLVVMASETLTLREVELFRRHFPAGSYLVNQVGTTESHNYCLYPIDHQTQFEGAVVPGGYPASEDRDVLILGEQREALPAGSTGEIGVKSSYLCSGYWHDDEMTVKKFVPLAGDGVPVYLTGDLGKVESDGCLIHLGRKDFQVKIRGYRVELAEIEHLLTNAPGIADCAAWVVQDRLGQDRLLGYVILKDGTTFRQEEVEKFLDAQVPEYMVPRHYVVLDSFPSLPTGKVDRNALPNPFARQEQAQHAAAVTASATPESQVSELFRELLHLSAVTPELNFLDAGGDSLLTAVLLQRVHQEHGVEVTIDEFLEAPTPSRLARLIREVSQTGSARASRVKSSSAVVELLPKRDTLGWDLPIAAVRSREATGDAAADRGNLVIISASSFAREVVLWAAETIAAGAPFRIKGFLDERRHVLDGFSYEVGILGGVEDYVIEEGDVFLNAIGDPVDKARYCAPIIERGGRFVNLIHHTANVASTARLGAGIVLGPFSSVTADAHIGDHVSMGALSNIGHDATVGDWCQISSHCAINGRSEVGDGAFVGSQACILPGVKVGAWSHIGAGSIVVRDVEPYCKVFGNPAVPIGKRTITCR